MKASLSHVGLHVSNFVESLRFYKDLFKYFGWSKVYGDKFLYGWRGINGDVWIVKTPGKYLKPKFHRKRTGLNHIAFQVANRKAVDVFYKNFLRRKKINTLYGGPKEYPQYEKGYYAVYFEDPDRIKLEVVYLPK